MSKRTRREALQAAGVILTATAAGPRIRAQDGAVPAAEVTREQRATGRSLTLFFGSNIGNFDPPGADAFLRNVRAALTEGDALLLGADRAGFTAMEQWVEDRFALTLVVAR